MKKHWPPIINIIQTSTRKGSQEPTLACGSRSVLWVMTEWPTQVCTGCSLGSEGLGPAPLSQAQGKSDLFPEVLLSCTSCSARQNEPCYFDHHILCLCHLLWSRTTRDALSVSVSLTKVLPFFLGALAVSVCQLWLSVLTLHSYSFTAQHPGK